MAPLLCLDLFIIQLETTPDSTATKTWRVDICVDGSRRLPESRTVKDPFSIADTTLIRWYLNEFLEGIQPDAEAKSDRAIERLCHYQERL